jgi:hypothetical protein
MVIFMLKTDYYDTEKGVNFDSGKLFIFPGLTEKMGFDESDFVYSGMNDLKLSDFHKNILK